MTNVLLVILIIMLLITMIASVVTAAVIISASKSKELIHKILKIISVSLIVVLIIGAAIGASYIKKDNSSDNTIDENVTLTEAGFNEITIDEYLALIKESSENVILIARPTCGYCEKFTPILKKASEDMNVKINYIDTDKLTEETWKSFNASFDIFSGEWGTPLVLVTKDSKIVAKNDGYTDLTTIKKFFKDNKLGE